MYLPYHLFSLISIVVGYGISKIIYLDGQLLKKSGIALLILTIWLTLLFVSGYSFIGYVADYLTFYFLILLWSILNFSLLKSKNFTYLGLVFMFLGILLLLSGSLPFGKKMVFVEIDKLPLSPNIPKDGNQTNLYFKNAYPFHAVVKLNSYNYLWSLYEKKLIFEKEVAYCVFENYSDFIKFKTMKADPMEYHKYMSVYEDKISEGQKTAIETALNELRVANQNNDIQAVELANKNLEEKLGMSNYYRFQNKLYFIEELSGKRIFFANPYY